jgi:NitT/TauT family transport system substrate-binding protein
LFVKNGLQVIKKDFEAGKLAIDAIDRWHRQRKNSMSCLRRTYVPFLLVSLILWHCSDNPSVPTGPAETITVAAYAGDTGMLVYLAEALEHYRQNNLNVIIKDYESGKQATDAMLAGQADVSTATDFVFVSNSLNHADLRTIGTIAMADVNELVARKDRGILAPKDLKGKTIGITKKSVGEFMLGRFLLFNDILMEDIRIVDLTPGELIRSITSGQIDAALTWDPNIYIIKNMLGKNAMNWRVQDGQYFNFMLITREKWIERHFAAGKRLLFALVQTEQYARLNPSMVRAFIQKRFNYSEEYVSYIYSRHQFSVTLPQALILTMEDQAQWRIDNRLAKKIEVPNFLTYIHTDMLVKVNPESITVIR